MRRPDKMALGTFVYADGFNPASWRHPGSPVHGSTNFAHMLNIARSPQGRPVIAQAGGSAAGIELAAEMAEIVFSLASSLDANRRFYETLKGRMPAFGALQDFVELVVPELQRRGLLRTEYSASTLRDHLGLSFPEGRYDQG
jgi:alkanesulfonate monooxygenase SsuD/methylene tetrahydromethanopterin reductase-like flavin-dependent oxidoreductase (luciferase family)